jgi:type VI secretion system Hcp family effector
MSMYLDVVNPKIEGESSSTVTSDWNKKILIESMDFSVSQQASKSNTGLVASGSQVGPLSIRKQMDKSTPQLFYHLASGTPLDTVLVRVSRTGTTGGPFEAETYVLENALVSSYHTSGIPGTGGLPEETWSLSFTKITERYQSVKPNSDVLDSPDAKGFDFGSGTQYTSSSPAFQSVNSWRK